MTTSSDRSNLSPLKQAYLALEEMQARLEVAERAKHEPIAIVGIGCRLPGGANDPESFWQNLRRGVDAIRDVPPERWDIDAVYDPDPNAPGKTYVRQAGFLDCVDLFDPQFFGIAPREAVAMDPQQRLLLEVAWEALENAAQAPDKLVGSRTGVFIGIASGDYANLYIKANDPAKLDAYYSSGVAHSIASGRLSYVLGLQGPSISLDTACSSSLVAVHLAVLSLRLGECNLALAGGVNLILSPDNSITFSRLRMLAPDARCKTFDARADGFADGEGCGIIVLKRLADALAEGDRILAVIRGTAVNQDGASSGLTAPNGPSQEAVIREAFANGGVQPHEVGYVEAHGTGTSLGDPIEVQALGAVLRQERPAERPFLLGSVKTNVGHLEAAAGVTGLIKAVLMLHHGEIPPHLHFQTPSPFIPWNEIPAVVPTQLMPWPDHYARRIAGVSSFGFSGTNAHVVLEQAPAEALSVVGESDRPWHILTLSAKSDQALRDLASRCARHLDIPIPNTQFPDICFTANTGRAHLSQRLALSADSTGQARGKLAAFLGGQSTAGLITGEAQTADRPKIAFLFTGQGAQYIGMGRRLYETEPIFRQSLDRCAEILRPYLDQPLLSVLYIEHPMPNLNETIYTQPALFALEYSLAELWRSWGIQPNAVMGHSVGEYVAACVAGVFSLEDGLKLIAARGRLMQSLPRGGEMAAVFADEARVAQVIESFSDQVSLAAINGPDNTVISGVGTAVQAVLECLEAQGVKSKKLVVSHAFHSPLMEPILDEFERVASEIKFSAPRLRLISNVTGQSAIASEVTSPAYWRQHIRQPVRFADSMQTLRQLGLGVFVEIGPQPTLLGMGKRCLPEDAGLWLPSLRQGQDDGQQILASLAALYVHGVDVDWRGFDQPYSRRKLALPTYPFQRERYWLDAGGKRQEARGRSLQPSAFSLHPLLGQRLRSALKEIQFESEVSTSALAFLNDHRIYGTAVMPATGYLEAFVAAAQATLGAGTHALEDVVIHEGLIVPDEAERTTQLIVKPDGAGAASLQFFSLEVAAPPGARDESEWKLHASAQACSIPTAPTNSPLAEIRARCSQRISAEAHYQTLREHGLDFGPSLHGVQNIWRRDGEALGELALPPALAAEAAAYQIHPALLDAGLQIMAATFETADVYLPIGIERVHLYQPPGTHLWSHAVIRSVEGSDRETLAGDVRLLGDDGTVIAELVGLRLVRADRQALQRIGAAQSPIPTAYSDWLYETFWRPQPRPSDTTSSFIPALAQMAEQVQPHVAPLALQHGLAVYRDLLPQIESLALDYVLAALRQLGWEMRPGERVTAESLARRLGVIDQHQCLLGRLLDMLGEENILQRAGVEYQVVRVPDVSDPLACQSELAARFPIGSAELTLLGRCGPQLAQALRGQADPLQLLFPGGADDAAEQLYHHSPFARTYNSLVREAVMLALARLPQGRTLRILEVGAGTGGTTSYLLPALPVDRVEYTFTDISPLFTAKAQQRFERYTFVRYQALDIERDPPAQGLAPRYFDLVIAANVIHATADLRLTLQHVRQLLAPDGLLILIEVNRPQRWVDLTFGLTEGWWKFTDHDLRPGYPLLAQKQWLDLLTESGFTQATALPRDAESDFALSLQSIIMARAPRAESPGRWLILADASGVGDKLASVLEARGESCALIRRGDQPPDFPRVLREAIGAQPCRGVVHLWSLDICEPDEAVHDQMLGAGSALNLVQALVKTDGANPPRLWLITRNAQPIDRLSGQLAIAQSPVWGLGKTIALEHPELHCTRIDLDPAAPPDEIDALAAELLLPNAEDQIALRDDTRFVARLAQYQIPTTQHPSPIKLEVISRGTLDNLALQPMTRRSPGPGEVELQVYATGLNFKDVMNVLGMYPGDPGPLGGECSGKIVAMGDGVTGLQVGDDVIALAGGSFASFVTTPAEFVVRKPVCLSFEQAATIAIPFITAYFTLNHLGHIKPGDRVLIHAAAGGVGQAAVQLAQRAGAEIFATAGSAEKREFLQSLGVQHVMNSRTLDFADEIMSLTQGRGVDLVLNSLAGEFIQKSLAVLAEGGRFLEIGKSGLLDQEQQAQLGRGIAYHVVDWSETLKSDPALIRSILLDIVASVEAGHLKPLPYLVFPIADAIGAFRTMSQARHIGKLVITQPTDQLVRSDATYLITGGLGGLGLITARWLVDRGARHLLLMGRHAPDAAARQTIGALEQSGAHVVIAQGDVSRADDVARILAQIASSMPPLRGIIHAAGVLDDGVLVLQNWPRFQKVMAPKVDGAWHLHNLTQDMPLDWFVMFSSVASALGSAGQGNHAAANTFMDALAHQRRALGLPALSINWGAWSQVGAAVEHGVGDRIASQGVGSISPEQGLQIMEHLLKEGATQVAVLPVEWARFMAQLAPGAIPPFLFEMAVVAPQPLREAPKPAVPLESEWRKRLKEAPPAKQRGVMIEYVRTQAAHVLALDAAKIRERTPLSELGLDSLMAVELRNLLGAGLALDRKLPATLVFDYPTVEAMADYLMREIMPESKSQVADREPQETESGAVNVVESIEELSDDEVDRLLAEKMGRQ